MKINSLLAKTALAAAIAGASFTAAAGTLSIATPSVVAIELFGEAKSAEGASNQTSITLPEIKFNTDIAESGSIKLTLAETDAVFSSDFNTPANWESQGVVIKVDGTELDENNVTAVDAGTQGNNVIIIHTTETLDGDITIEGLKVWNLRDTHNKLNGTTAVNVELQGASKFDSAPNEIAIYTAKGVELTSRATGYDFGASATRGYIEVATNQTQFTDAISVRGADPIVDQTTAAHRDTFDADSAVQELYLGELSLARGKVTVGGNDFDAGNEQGSKFQISGGDTLTLTLSSDVALNNYNLQLNSASDCGAATAESTAANNIYSNDGKTVELKLNSVVDLDASTPYHLCAVATGGERLEQINSLLASVAVDYTNVRYGRSAATVDFGAVRRNGCSVTLFNLPNATGRDVGNIRFTNTSATQSGEVSVSAYAQDGSVLASDVVVLDNLAPHATALLQSRAGNGVDLSAALGDFEGRARIQINGAFPSCEALGLVSRSGGDVVNMTSTVYSGSANGTSNTDN